jgi:hypothetical protein
VLLVHGFFPLSKTKAAARATERFFADNTDLLRRHGTETSYLTCFSGSEFRFHSSMPSTSSQAPCSSATVGEGPYLQHLAAVDYPRRDRSDARTQRTSEGAELSLEHHRPRLWRASPQICVYSTVPSATKIVTGRQDKNPALLFDIRSRKPPACVHLHLKNPTAPCQSWLKLY